MVYASDAEKAKAKILEAIEKNEELSEHDKTVARMSFNNGFDLGFQCGHEYCEREKKKWMDEIMSMSPEDFKNYGAIYRGINLYETRDIIRMNGEMIKD